MIRFTLNGEDYEFDGADDTPLLWVIRDSAGLTGTKYGCGVGQCRACTVHVDGKARRACVTSVKAVADRTVTTIEGLSKNASHPVQQAWREINVRSWRQRRCSSDCRRQAMKKSIVSTGISVAAALTPGFARQYTARQN
jgi:ferredoxin